MIRSGTSGSAKMAVPTWTAYGADGQVVEGVVEGGDPPDPHDRDIHDLRDFVYDPQAHRLDRRAGQAAVDFAEERFARPRVDGHTRQRVDRGERVGTRAGDRLGDRAHVRDVRGEPPMSGRSVTRRTAAVTVAAASRSTANWRPPRPTFGQLMLSSMPAMPGMPSSLRATPVKSSIE